MPALQVCRVDSGVDIAMGQVACVRLSDGVRQEDTGEVWGYRYGGPAK